MSSWRKSRRRASPPPLPRALDAIAAAAGEVVSRFCCGGDFQPKAPIKLSCYDEAALGKCEALLLTIPACSEAEIPDLLSRCQQASFGKGTTTVLDPSYRSALCLSPTCFSTNFSLEQYGVLDTIKTLMMPETAGTLTAQLYKLNVYRPGDFFKSHVDTPRGSGMFGSLVVCLPQPHTGGQLKLQTAPAVQKQQQQQQQHVHKFDWGANSSKGAVQWAAFYSDCPHEILPVESGYRITLTYNLFIAPGTEDQPQLPGLSASSMALHAALKAALDSPDFMPSGGTLGFACQHVYPHTQEELCQHVASMLKGGDAAVLAVARDLGLEAEVQAVYDTTQLEDYGVEQDDDEEDEEGAGAGFADPSLRLGELSPSSAVAWSDQDFSRAEAVQQLFKSTSCPPVAWCLHPSRWALQLVNASYGNESTVKEWYSAAAVMVKVPAHALRMGGAAAAAAWAGSPSGSTP